MPRRALRAAILLAWLCGAHAATVYYPPPEAADDQRSDYQFQLLQLALQQDGHHFTAARSRTRMPQARSEIDLAACRSDLQVAAFMTSPAREDALLPIRIPIDRGLIGWRLALLRRDDATLLQHVRRKADLTPFVAGQGPDWPDTAILQANGLTVNATGQYAALFQMLASRRFDYFPRSVNEIWPELASHRALGLHVDSTIVLHYPAAVYFFVCPRNQPLAQAIQNGLEKALADGSMRRLFQRYYRQALARADIPHRTVIELDNPLLPAATPLQHRNLWWRPGER